MFSTYPDLRLHDLDSAYDYIIIGGGTAGCVLANRLSREEDTTVLLVEQGGVSNGWIARVPLLSTHFSRKSDRSRSYKTVPQRNVGDRVYDLPSACSLGGGSKVNSMLYTRGVPAEFNAWSAAGRKGWSYDDIQKYFVMSESDLDQKPFTKTPDYHGISGEWPNRSFAPAHWTHTSHTITATTGMLIPYVNDLNSPLHPAHGCALMHYNIDGRGERSSTLAAFLPKALAQKRRRRLHICTYTVGSKIEVVHDGEKHLRVDGVHLLSTQTSATRFIRARREVIVASGPLGSPKLLLLSGIGPAAHLEKHGIPVIKDLPGVGSHLQDHAGIPLYWLVPMRDSAMKLMLRPWLFIIELFLYIFFGVAYSLHPYPSYLSSYSRDYLMPIGTTYIEVMPLAIGPPEMRIPKGAGGFSLLGVTLRPTSTGTVRLASINPLKDPIIDTNYMATEYDRILARKCVRFCQALRERIVQSGYPLEDGLGPEGDDDESVDKFVDGQLITASHYSSTCRMAPEEEQGVVDDELRVHGIKGLRVADSSIFPQIPATHLAAPTVMVAEKCADMVKHEYISNLLR